MITWAGLLDLLVTRKWTDCIAKEMANKELNPRQYKLTCLRVGVASIKAKVTNSASRNFSIVRVFANIFTNLRQSTECKLYNRVSITQYCTPTPKNSSFDERRDNNYTVAYAPAAGESTSLYQMQTGVEL